MNKTKMTASSKSTANGTTSRGLASALMMRLLLPPNANGLLTSASVGSALWRDRRGLLTLMTSANAGTARWAL